MRRPLTIALRLSLMCNRHDVSSPSASVDAPAFYPVHNPTPECNEHVMIASVDNLQPR